MKGKVQHWSCCKNCFYEYAYFFCGIVRYIKTRAQFHRAAKQPILCLLYIFHFIALLTVKHRERHANLQAGIASKWVMQQYKSMVTRMRRSEFSCYPVKYAYA